MTPLDAGAALPDLTLDGPDGPIRLHDVAARGPLIIAFYQEDATPICTAQLCAFRDDFDLIGGTGARLLAISADDRTSHDRFQAAQSFPFRCSATPRGRPRGPSACWMNPRGAACGRSSSAGRR